VHECKYTIACLNGNVVVSIFVGTGIYEGKTTLTLSKEDIGYTEKYDSLKARVGMDLNYVALVALIEDAQKNYSFWNQLQIQNVDKNPKGEIVIQYKRNGWNTVRLEGGFSDRVVINGVELDQAIAVKPESGKRLPAEWMKRFKMQLNRDFEMEDTWYIRYFNKQLSDRMRIFPLKLFPIDTTRFVYFEVVEDICVRVCFNTGTQDASVCNEYAETDAIIKNGQVVVGDTAKSKIYVNKIEMPQKQDFNYRFNIHNSEVKVQIPNCEGRTSDGFPWTTIKNNWVWESNEDTKFTINSKDIGDLDRNNM